MFFEFALVNVELLFIFVKLLLKFFLGRRECFEEVIVLLVKLFPSFVYFSVEAVTVVIKISGLFEQISNIVLGSNNPSLSFRLVKNAKHYISNVLD